ncbi:MAG: CBS domain-containing protein [Azonexus sp.]|nr:CBS domain-containing protein [Azonexus sp.]
MTEPKVLGSRVTGAHSEYPMHQRVPRLTVGSVLKGQQGGLHTIDSGFRSLDALRLLADKNGEAALVLDAGRLMGIFSLQNFARTTALAGMSAMTAPVSDATTPCNCLVSLDDSAQTCLQLMDEHHLEFMPVQETGRLVALLSRADLLSEVVSNYEKIFRESALDQQILFLRGTYSC